MDKKTLKSYKRTKRPIRNASLIHLECYSYPSSKVYDWQNICNNAFKNIIFYAKFLQDLKDLTCYRHAIVALYIKVLQRLT